MRRVWLVTVSAALVIAVGCGRENYEKRMRTTLENLEYARRLKKNLMDPPGEKKFQDLSIFIRAPKEEAMAKTGGLSVGEGQFDLDASFIDAAGSTLHLLARVKMPKKPPTKGAPPPPPAAARGEFVGDVLGVLINNLGSPEGLQAPKFVEERTKKGNTFKRLIFTAGDKEARLYTYKDGNHEVALVFIYDAKLKGPLSSKIDLCLDSFRTGLKATQAYAGANPDEEPESGPPVPL